MIWKVTWDPKLYNYKKLIACGANILVAGNTVFSANNPSEIITKLKS